MNQCNITSRSLILAGLLESNKTIKLQPRFKVCNISYLRVLFHSSELLLTFRYISHKKIKGKECIHVTTVNIDMDMFFVIKKNMES
jgi:hypothetical protein